MTKYALIIAIPEYNHFKPLEKTTNDAETIAKILHQYGDYEITRFPRKGNADTAEYEMKAGKVTVNQLYEELKLFFNQITQGQSALVYFTGHGFTCHQFDEEEGFLATSDTQVKAENNKINDQNNGFPLKRLDSLIQKVNLSELVLLLDCCHSGNFIETHLIQKSLQAFEYKKNYYLITASRSFETAKTIKKAEHSVFSGAIIDGLSDNNKNEKGKISCDRLFDFVNTKIGGKLQTPMRMGIGGSITLVKYPLADNQEIPEIEPIRDNNGEIVCPYQGLNVFTSKEKEFFFGRQRLTEDIKQKIEEFGVIPIIGASGTGKSSVVYAGVMTWLEAENEEWCILPTIKPGSKPLSQLIQVFKEQVSLEESELDEIIEDDEKEISDIVQFLPNSRKYFLFIDQFEEVFTVCSRERERKRFIDLITQIKVKNPYKFAIITTMRADFLDYCLQYQSLHQIIQHRAIYIPPLQEKNIQEIIIKPAQRQGYQIENELLLRLLSDVGKKQGFLPLLEFALTLLWEKRDETTKTLTLDAYEKLGEEKSLNQGGNDRVNTGLTKALDIYAEKVYNYQDYDRDNPKIERTDIEKELIKLIFLRLIRTGDQAKDTRQRQPKTIILNIAGEEETQQKTLNKLIDGKQGLVSARLLVTATDNQNHSTVDLVHEALIEGWQQFKLWREENRELRQLSERLEDQRQQWLKNPIDENLMMGGLLMQVRQQWEELRPFLLHPTEDKEFYQKSDEYEQERILELENLNQAIANARTAIKLEIEGSRALDKLNKHQPTQALLTAVKAGKALIPLKQADGNYPASSPILALNTLWYKLPRRVDLIDHQDLVRNAQFSPDGTKIVTASYDGTTKVWDMTGKLITTLEGHEYAVINAQFSPDGTKIVTASDDHTAKVWDMTGKLITTLEGHEYAVINAQFSPDGTKIVTASDDHTAKVWDITGKLLTTLEGHQDSVVNAQFSPDGTKIVTASYTAKVWDITGKLLTTLEGHQEWVKNAQFSPDGTKIVTASGDNTAKVWDITGKLITTFEDHQEWVNNAQFSPDGTKIVTASGDNTAKVWDITGKLITTFEDHQEWVNNAQFSPDGTKIVTASGDNTAKLWDITGKLITTLEGHEYAVINAQFSPDGTKIVTASEEDNTAKLWDITEKLIITLEGHQKRVINAQFSPDGTKIVTASEDNTAKLWDITGKLIITLEGHQNWVINAQFSPDGTKIVTASDDHTAKVWDITGKLLTTLEGHQDSVVNAQFSSDGTKIVTASDDHTAKLWDITGKLITTLEGHEYSVNNAQFSPDGTKIVTASGDNTAKLWDITGKLITTLEGHQEWVNNAQFSPDGTKIVTASKDNTAKLWDITGKLITTLEGHQTRVINAQFSPDGTKIVTASEDNTAKVWDITGKLITTLEGHQNWVNNAQFSRDGSKIVTASEDKNAKVWDSSGKLITTLEGDQDLVINAQFSRDGSKIVTASYNETAKIWPVHTLEELVSWGCEWLKGNLPSEEAEREYEEICKS